MMIQQATWQVAFQLDAPYNGDGVFMDDDHDDDDDDKEDDVDDWIWQPGNLATWQDAFKLDARAT